MQEAVVAVWYVIQVMHGREDAMARLIGRVVPAEVMGECFSPTFETETKVKGEWVRVKRQMLPGYLIAVTDEPRCLADAIAPLPEFCRVLMQGGRFIPLGRDEVELIDGFTRTGARCVPMSAAVKEGDRVVVTEGPLKGHEALIAEMNRHKSLAYLELDICGRRVRTRVGLGVLSAKRAEERAAESQDVHSPS